MKIDRNPTEMEAMRLYHEGKPEEARKVQEEFLQEFRKEFAERDHCSCTEPCRYHGNCRECVAMHRGHQEHLPYCLRPLLNEKLKPLIGLTENSVIEELEEEK